MSDEDENGREERTPEKSTIDEQRRGFHLEAGLRPLSDLLGNLVEVNMSNAPPPPTATEETGEWSETDETEGDHHRTESKPERKRTKHVRTSTTDQCLIDTRLSNGELTIMVDIPGAKKDDISIGRNPRTNKLVISKDGTVIGRVDLPWESPKTTKVWFNNGVLEIRMRSKAA